MNALLPKPSLFFNPHLEKPRLIQNLSLFIPEMESEETQRRVRELLRTLPGILDLCLTSRCVSVSYRPRSTAFHDILATLRSAGFHPSVFQDSGSVFRAAA